MENQITNIEKLALSGKKVFTIADLAVMWQIPERRMLIERIKYYLREKRLISITKGVYAYGEGYTPLDIAQKLVPLAYISLYTTSQIHGLTFQYYAAIYCISLKSKTYTLNEQNYIYHKVKEQIFYNKLGLVDNGRYLIADKERTICDCLYVFPGFSFDNLRGIDREKLEAMAKMYDNKRLEREVDEVIKRAKMQE
jgi:predicted transcriptional regulator of viral defense system